MPLTITTNDAVPRHAGTPGRHVVARGGLVAVVLALGLLAGCGGSAPQAPGADVPTVSSEPAAGTVTPSPETRHDRAETSSVDPTTPERPVVTTPPRPTTTTSSPPPTFPLPPTFRHDATHYTTTTSTLTVGTTIAVFVDDHALALADSLEVTVAIGTGVDVTGIDINDVIRRYTQALVVDDRAFAAPGDDWSDALRAYMTEDLATQAVADLREFHGKHLRSIGHARFDDEVTSVSRDEVVIAGCVDTVGMMVHNDGDLPITPAGGAYFPHRAVMTRSDGGQWYVSETSTDQSRRCGEAK